MSERIFDVPALKARGALAGDDVQRGSVNLVNGVGAVNGVRVLAASTILVGPRTTIPGAGNLTLDYRVLSNGIHPPDAFEVSAVLADGQTVNALDQSQGIGYLIIN